MSDVEPLKQLIQGLVSVIIATHNRRSLLQRSILSVLSQSYQNFEIIVVDDNSEDDTEEFLSTFTDSRIIYLKSNSRGRSHARNFGISFARGEFLAFLDDDDVYEKDKLRLQLELARKYPSFDFFIGKSLLRDNHENTLDDLELQLLDLSELRRSFLPGTIMLPSLFIRLDGVTNFYFDPDLDRFEDLDFYRRYLDDSRIHTHKDVVATVYTHPGNKFNPQISTNILRQLKIYRNKIGYFQPRSRAGMSLLYTYYGDALIKQPGFYLKGLWLLKKAVFLKPLPFRISRLKVLISLVKFLMKQFTMTILPINNRYLSKIKFGIIYRYKLFGLSESASGPGSDLIQTRELITVLPGFFSKHEVRSIADIPCGDFFWMSKLDLSQIEYSGYDIVSRLIKANKINFPHQNFHQLDITKKSIRYHDLILCRDLLVHLDFEEIFSVLKNFQLSGSKYLLTTTFPLLPVNQDLDQKFWRPINLEIEPFHFGTPIEIISEKSTEDPRYTDKSLGLWKISDIKISG